MTKRLQHNGKKYKNISDTSLYLISIPIIFMVIFAGYGNSLSAGFHFDDIDNIVNNEGIRSFHSLGGFASIHGYRRLLPMLTFGLNYAVDGYDVQGYHIVNIMIHSIASICVFFLITISINILSNAGKYKRKQAIAAGLAGAMVFASHPLQTQAVTYIVQRMALLATLFYLMAMIGFAQIRKGGSIKANIGYGILIFIGIVGGILSKEIIATLPIMVILYELYFKKAALFASKQRIIAVLIILTLLMLIVPLMFGNQLHSVLFSSKMSQRYGDPMLTNANYFLTQMTVIPRYIQLIFIPIGQTLDHDIAVKTSLFDVWVITGIIITLCLFLLAWRIRKNLKLLSFGILWFFVTLSVESSIIPLPNTMFEHRLYLPMIGVSYIVAEITLYTIKRWKIMRPGIVIALICIVLTALTWQRNTIWANEFTLWHDVIRKSPNKARGYYNLGNAYYANGQYDEADKLYERAVLLNPHYVRAYNNLGVIAEKEKKYERAIKFYQEAIDIETGYFRSYINLTRVYIETEKYDKAIDTLERMKDVSGESAQYYEQLGIIAMKRNDLEAAEKNLNVSLSIDSKQSGVYNNLGIVYSKMNKVFEAESSYKQSLEIDPKNAGTFYNLGLLSIEMGKYKEAAGYFEKTLKLNNNHVPARRNLDGIRKMIEESQGLNQKETVK